MNEMLEKLGQNAKDAETVLRNLSTNDKNKTLEAVAKALVAHTDEILKANALDVENGKKNQMPEGLIDRLMLTPERIEGMADGLRQLTGLEDPIGEDEKTSQRTSDRAETCSLRCDRHYLRSTSQCYLRCIRSLLQNRKCRDPEGWKRRDSFQYCHCQLYP
jgi:gamma-glutamyl phosphate reductase